MRLVDTYIEGINKCLQEILQQNVDEIAGIIYQAYLKGKQIFVMGNGGSASTASHFVCDLSLQTAINGKPRVRVFGLTDNMAVLTAHANDINYASVFREQLVTYLNKGDVVIGISASGNSPNVLEAIKYARERGAITIGFCGFNGGKLKEYAHKSIVLSSRNYGQVEGSHSCLTHIIAHLLREKIKKSK